MPTIGICKYCGKQYEKQYNAQKYCSTECKLKTQKPRSRRKIKICPVCGKEFKGYYKTTYCSMACASIANGKRIKVICDYCGKEYYIKKSKIDKYKNNFCSVECRNNFMKKEKIFKICEYCGKEFIDTSSNKKKKYCSNECKHEAQMLNISKEELEKLYLKDKLTTREIAKIYNTSHKTIREYLKRYNIPLRSDGIKNRERILCKDGHKVRSYYEKAFDNVLTRFNIKHEYEPVLPWNKKYHADFLVGDVYVEIWGLMNLDSYRKKMEKKIEIYKNNNAKLLSVYPDDFKNIYKKIDELLQLTKDSA